MASLFFGMKAEDPRDRTQFWERKFDPNLALLARSVRWVFVSRWVPQVCDIILVECLACVFTNHN